MLVTASVFVSAVGGPVLSIMTCWNCEIYRSEWQPSTTLILIAMDGVDEKVL